jgi:hypothetical protein
VLNGFKNGGPKKSARPPADDQIRPSRHLREKLGLSEGVITSVMPDATVGVAKLIVDYAPLIPPAITWTVGLVVSVTPRTLVVSVLAVPAVVPVKKTM